MSQTLYASVIFYAFLVAVLNNVAADYLSPWSFSSFCWYHVRMSRDAHASNASLFHYAMSLIVLKIHLHFLCICGVALYVFFDIFFKEN